MSVAQVPRLVGFTPPRAASARLPTDTAFAVLILMTGTLFMRPAEIVPALEGWPIYEVLNLACLLLALPAICQRFERDRLVLMPIAVCVLGLQVAVIASFLGRFAIGEAIHSGHEFFKVVVYFVLLVTLVDSPQRMRRLLFWLLCFTLALTVLALLQYHGYIDMPAMAAVRELWGTSDDSGEEIVDAIYRLCAAGIFANPNDLSRILDLAIFVALHFILTRSEGPARVLWLVPLGVFLYALHLTQSRGGVIGLLAGLATYSVLRWGKARTFLIGLAATPVLLVVLSARQLEMSTSEGTGQLRIQLWSEGLGELVHSPLLGIGKDKVDEQIGNGCHNSFVQCFVEEGLIGGTFFTGTFYLAALGILRATHIVTVRGRPVNAAIWDMRPCVAAIVIGYAAGMLSSTRSYAVPTYLVLGLATAYLQMLPPGSLKPSYRFDTRMAYRLGMVGLVVLVVFYVYVRFAVRW